MGNRVVFYKSVSGDSLKDVLIDAYLELRAWALMEQESRLKTSNEMLLSPALHQFLQRSADLEQLSTVQQQELDELVGVLLLEYNGEANLFENVGASIATKHYKSVSSILLRQSDDYIKWLWSYLIEGRSLMENLGFLSPEEENYVIGYWTSEEITALQAGLLSLEMEGEVVDVLKSVFEEEGELVFFVETPDVLV